MSFNKMLCLGSDDDSEDTYLIWVIGSASSGKTSLTKALLSRPLAEKTTLNSTTTKSVLTFSDGNSRNFEVREFRDAPNYVELYKASQPLFVLITFDILQPNGLEKLVSRYNGLLKYTQPLLVGTKADFLPTSLPQNNGQDYSAGKRTGEKVALSMGGQFIMVSSKTMYGIDDLKSIIYDNVIQTEREKLESSLDVCYKPVIYFYPQMRAEINVNLELKGKLLHSYPKPLRIEETPNMEDIRWEIIANPNGEIINKENNKQYNYIFWEGHQNTIYDFSTGFVVEGKDVVSFMEEKLGQLGLKSNEANDFITFWMPQLENNKYNLISFQREAYTSAAELRIDPKPDNLIRVYMAIRVIDQPIEIPEQKLDEISVKRGDLKGFSVIEWGGGFH